MKTGRNEPCHCGSGKKYKHCCLELDRLNQSAEHAMTVSNNLTVPEFHGLSPNEMDRMLYQPFDSADVVEFPDLLTHPPLSPVTYLFNCLVEGIGDEGAKVTAKGNLPRKICKDAAARYAEYDPDRLFLETVNKEEDFFELNGVRKITEMIGLIRKHRGKFQLTKKCHQLLGQGEDMRALYPILLKAYAKEFNWGYFDSFDELPGIQHTFLFTLYLLSLYGNEWRPCTFYEDAFVAAFPAVVSEVSSDDWREPETTVRSAYNTRALSRFAVLLGLATKRMTRNPGIHGYDIKATALLADAVRFNRQTH